MNLHNQPPSPRIVFFPVKYFIVVAEFNVEKITKVAALFVNTIAIQKSIDWYSEVEKKKRMLVQF